MFARSTLAPALALALIAGPALAQAPETKITPVEATDLPPAVVAAVTKAAPGLKIKEAELKVRENRRYYDVEGTLPDGAEIEFDLLEAGGRWKIVETQRDIAWTATPQPVRDAAVKAAPKVAPVRVIESTQADGEVIYELFAEGQPTAPALEVSWKGGGAKVLTQAWPH
ncbi:PepSY domain-containing protein [Caulobacter sp. BK020]|uniref:PepSY domain-containing protein n=1 Tax=Caulobacter sp. BK020 TaxID=2512117 RepID=UPI001042CB09|nr:PepSY domain-containing protein [Caulobacter sp. BK020]TCS14511.1 YpeB-like protein with putative protease inhibitory function [Caulobacter sp. BK020]